jgi:mycothiol synthase
MAATPSVESLTRLDPPLVAEVRRLVAASTDADGVSALSEHVLLHLDSGGDVAVRHLLVHAGDALAGYAHVDVSDTVAGSSAELVVAPAQRRHGIGRLLAEAALAASPDGRLRLWAHGEHPGAAVLADRLGFVKTRELWQLRRSLLAPLPPGEPPDDVTIRTFIVGEDEDSWLAVNNRAFADHPEQGGWSLDDIRRREAEPWFDPRGFFLAERDGALVGFHWTKVHGGATGTSGHAHEPIGEVYVVGVDPGAQSKGLGRALTLVGLRHLRARGLPQAMLYVDESNTSAVRLYTELGFAHWATDISYSRGVAP